MSSTFNERENIIFSHILEHVRIMEPKNEKHHNERGRGKKKKKKSRDEMFVLGQMLKQKREGERDTFC